ncbi:MAG: hypothetical protein KDA90_10765 [Planctomycetaceae bacterium]|nr:hypothetical protein [Planctomycetaceae bacterium]
MNGVFLSQLSYLVTIPALLAALGVTVVVSAVALRVAATVLKMDAVSGPAAFRIAAISTLVHAAIRSPTLIGNLAILGGTLNNSRTYMRFSGGEAGGMLMAAMSSGSLLPTLIVLAFTAALIQREVRPDDRYDQFEGDEPLKQAPPMSLMDASILATTHYAVTVLFLTLLAVAIFSLIQMMR